MIYIGESKITDVYLGTTAITSIYRGTDLVYVAKRLPSGYAELEYLESSGGAYINLPFGFYKTDEVDIEFGINATSENDKYIIAATTWNDNINRFGFGKHDISTGGSSKRNTFNIGYGGVSTGSTALKPYEDNNFDTNIHRWTYKDYVCSIAELGLSIDVSSYTFIGETDNLKLFYGYNTPTSGRVASYIHKKNGVVICQLIPCINSQGVYGMLDSANSDKNLFDKHNIDNTGYLIGNNIYVIDGWSASDYIEIKGDTDYTSNATDDSTMGEDSSTVFYDENKVYISHFDYSNKTYPYTFTTPSNAKYVRVSVRDSQLESYQLEQGTTATAYTPYGGFYTNSNTEGEFTGKIKLPRSYTAYDYITPNNTNAFIDTGYIANDNSVFSIDTKNDKHSGASFQVLFGSQTSSNTKRCVLLYGSINDVQIAWGNQTSSTILTSGILNIGEWHTFELSKEKIVCNGVDYQNSDSTDLKSSELPIYLFARNSAGTSDSFAKNSSVREFYIKENNEFIHHFVPCSNDNGEVGMYDIISKQFFGNANTDGQFIGGYEAQLVLEE